MRPDAIRAFRHKRPFQPIYNNRSEFSMEMESEAENE